MPALNLPKHVYLAYFSKPAGERAIYRAIRRGRPRSIVEIGVGSGLRAQRMIKHCIRTLGSDNIRYTGIDLFEARESSRPGITIKLAHKLLKPLAAKVQLVPGDPYGALARTANSLTQTDLVVIGADQDADALGRAWFYLPRMLSERSLVLVEQETGQANSRFRSVPLAEITQLAEQSNGREAA